MNARPRFGQPLWLGETSVAGKTILVHAEQGLGDTLQFARYVPLLARSGAKVLVEVQPELKRLLSDLAGAAAIFGRGEPLPAFDLQCPLASLPLAFKTELATIPAEIPYVAAGDDRIATWRERLSALPRPRIAIAWSGRPTHVNDRNRSIALAKFAPLLSLPGIQFISVQRELRPEDTDLLTAERRLAHVGDALEDFSDTAAVLALVDRVICVDTSVAHLAAAMGRPTTVLVPFQPDWRWLRAGDRSPWYPAVELYRQSAPGDWGSVITRLRDNLASEFRAKQ